MPNIISNVIIEPKTLSSSEREGLINSLYAVHCEIFDGVSRDEFAHYVVESSANETKIQISHGEDGDIAGYTAAHSFHRKLRGEKVLVTRAEAGLRRPYRGNSSATSFLLSQMLRTRWEFSGPQYYLGCLVHPSSYSAFARRAPTLWPMYGAEISPDIFDFMLQLADEFHLSLVDPTRPLVRQVGWITRDTEAERRYWSETDLPAPRFYLEQNPGYSQGHGLLTLIPLDAVSMAKTAIGWGASQIKKSVRRAVGALERSVIKSRLDADSAEDLLEILEEATGFDLSALREYQVLGTRYPVAARTVLLEEGELHATMYAVVKGSLFILGKDEQGEEFVIDQVGPGKLVGEMGLLTRRPEAAKVRAAVDSVLLRLTEQDLTQLLLLDPRLSQVLWLQVCRRLFIAELRQLPSLPKLSPEQKLEWFAEAIPYDLRQHQTLYLPETSTVVLAQGRLRSEGPHGWMTLSAPCVFQQSADTELTALEPVHCAVLPPEYEG